MQWVGMEVPNPNPLHKPGGVMQVSLTLCLLNSGAKPRRPIGAPFPEETQVASGCSSCHFGPAAPPVAGEYQSGLRSHPQKGWHSLPQHHIWKHLYR